MCVVKKTMNNCLSIVFCQISLDSIAFSAFANITVTDSKFERHKENL